MIKKPDTNGLEIAVIGMACRLPGNIVGADEYFNTLLEGKSLSIVGQHVAPGKEVRVATNLESKETFDASFFDYSDFEADMMNPQTRIFHECVWEALEDAGYASKTKNQNIGLFASATKQILWEASLMLEAGNDQALQLDSASHANTDFMATKISYNLRFTGPSISIQSACSSSLVAIHQACQALISGDCEMALAGGVSAAPHLSETYEYQHGMIYSQDGMCRPFDINSDGTFPGEGAGVVLLKPLEDAIKDGDFIHGIIKGSAVNNDGYRKVGYQAPSVQGQVEVINKALLAAEVLPETIDYIEAHGTGTSLGDSVELKAIHEVFGNVPLHLGSVKSNIGHTDVASGVLGFIKTVMLLKKQQLPKQINFTEFNPNLKVYCKTFTIDCENKDLRTEEDEELRAGISSFGIGGTNAHVILESFSSSITTEAVTEKQYLIPLSAPDFVQLKEYKKRIWRWLQRNQEVSLEDIQYSMMRRELPDLREIISVAKMADFVSALEEEPKVYGTASTKNKIVFQFPGQGEQKAGMGAEFYHSIPLFRDLVDRCEMWFKEVYPDESILDILINDGEEQQRKITKTLFAQPALFAYEYALAQVLIANRLQPDVLLGHSLGELVCASISGVFSLQDAFIVVMERGRLMQEAERGKMLAVFANVEEQNIPDTIDLAAINSTNQFVVSGAALEIDHYKKSLDENGVFCREISAENAFHSRLMEGVLTAFEDFLTGIELKKPVIPFLSNVTGSFISNENATNPKYWSSQIRKEVRFYDCINELLKDQYVLFEVGPSRVLSGFVSSSSDGKLKVVSTIGTNNGKSETNGLGRMLETAWCYGLIELKQVYDYAEIDISIGQHCSMPTRPFDVKLRRLLNYTEFLSKISDSHRQNVSINIHQKTEKEESEEIKPSVSELFLSVLNIKEIRPDEDFFQLGGDSLKYMRLASKIEKYFGVKLPLNRMFELCTVESLESWLSTSNPSVEYQEIAKVGEKAYYLSSSAQQRMYILNQLYPNDLSYNILEAYSVKGELSFEKVKKALKGLVERHEAFRTSFHREGINIVQKIETGEHDLKILYFGQGEASLDEVLKEINHPFILSESGLIRFAMLEVEQNSFILVFNVHHIILDGSSMANIMNDFRMLLDDITPPPLRIQYKDYAEWQQLRKTQNSYQREATFWKEFLTGYASLSLPYDEFIYDKALQEHGSLMLELPIDLHRGLSSFTRDNGVTLFMAMVSFYTILLHKMCGQEDILIGTPVSGRNHPDLIPLVGMFVNFLPIRNKVLPESSFVDYLDQVKTNVLQVFDNQEYQFDELKAELTKGDNTSDLINTVIVVQNYESAGKYYGGYLDQLQIEEIETVKKEAPFDLILGIYPQSESTIMKFDFDPMKFRIKTIETIKTMLLSVMEACLKTPSIALNQIEITKTNQHEPQIRKSDLGIHFDI